MESGKPPKHTNRTLKALAFSHRVGIGIFEMAFYHFR